MQHLIRVDWDALLLAPATQTKGDAGTVARTLAAYADHWEGESALLALTAAPRCHNGIKLHLRFGLQDSGMQHPGPVL